MLIRKKSKWIVWTIVIISFVPFLLKAQISSSPYTASGIGEIHKPGLIHNMGMGGVGIAHGNYWYLNTINPAMLTMNALSTFEVGLTTDFRSISDGTSTTSNTSGNIQYLAFAFPLKPGRWTLAFGMSPYSTINYDLRSTELVEGTQTRALYFSNGRGGLNQFYIANGFKIYKGLSLGLRANLYSGSIERDNSVIIDRYRVIDEDEVIVNYKTGIIERTSVADFGFNAGLSYRHLIGEKKALTFGLIYDLQSDLRSKRFERLELRTFDDNYTPIYGLDTVTNNILANNIIESIVIPARLGVGISYEVTSKYSIGADFYMQDWSNYKNTKGSNENLQASWSTMVGGEYTPNVSSLGNYFKRVTYRGGFNYERSPFYYNGTQINEFGINFGASFPVGRISNLNVAVKAGQRGTTDNNLLQERFIRASFGVTFNDKWFNRRQFD